MGDGGKWLHGSVTFELFPDSRSMNSGWISKIVDIAFSYPGYWSGHTDDEMYFVAYNRLIDVQYTPINNVPAHAVPLIHLGCDCHNSCCSVHHVGRVEGKTSCVSSNNSMNCSSLKRALGPAKDRYSKTILEKFQCCSLRSIPTNIPTSWIPLLLGQQCPRTRIYT